MNKQQQAALEAFMQYYDSREALGNWEKKTVGRLGDHPGYETTMSISDAYESILTILASTGDVELIAWLNEMHITIIQYGVQASILYKALKE